MGAILADFFSRMAPHIREPKFHLTLEDQEDDHQVGSL